MRGATGATVHAQPGGFGIVAATGIHNVERLIVACEGADLPAPACKARNLLADQLVDTQRKIQTLAADIRANEAARRLQTILDAAPGTRPITASALVPALPDVSGFGSGRDLSAWPDPQTAFIRWQGKAGRISKMGNRYLRRPLYPGAMAQIGARRHGVPGEDWLWRIMRHEASRSRRRSPWPTAWPARPVP